MVCAVQVGEDSHGNLLHLLAEVENENMGPVTTYVHTPSDVYPASTGAEGLKGKVRHRFSGTFNGSKSDYIRRAQNSGYDGQHKKRALLRMGITNLRRGYGAAVAAANALNILQVAHLWAMYSADGILTQEELVRMGIELAEGGNVVAAVKELGEAAVQGEGVLEGAAETGVLDLLVNGAIDVGKEVFFQMIGGLI